jgi:polyisoprenoid-binding protein YceI
MNAQTSLPTQASTTRGGTYTLDAGHSDVGFSVRHMMVSNVRGSFHAFSGTVTWDPTRPEATRIDVAIDVASIDTREPKRDEHLRSADFFDAEKYPKMTFTSRRATPRRGGGVDVVGDLTIRGTTREITLVVDDIAPEHADPWGNVRSGATAKATIRRSDFGMRWNAALEAGGVLVGDEIKIAIEAELIRDRS